MIIPSYLYLYEYRKGTYPIQDLMFLYCLDLYPEGFLDNNLLRLQDYWQIEISNNDTDSIEYISNTQFNVTVLCCYMWPDKENFVNLTNPY